MKQFILSFILFISLACKAVCDQDPDMAYDFNGVRQIFAESHPLDF